MLTTLVFSTDALREKYKGQTWDVGYNSDDEGLFLTNRSDEEQPFYLRRVCFRMTEKLPQDLQVAFKGIPVKHGPGCATAFCDGLAIACASADTCFMRAFSYNAILRFYSRSAGIINVTGKFEYAGRPIS